MGLYKRKGKDGKLSKTWRYDFTYEGKRYLGRIGPVTRKVAERFLTKYTAQAIEGKLKPRKEKPSPVFVTEKLLSGLAGKVIDDGSFASRYLDYSETNKRPRSFERDRVSIKALGSAFGGRRLADITSFDLERFKKTRREAGKSPATVNRELACLKAMFSMAIKWKLTKENPVKDVRMLREENTRLRYLTDDEGPRLLAACQRQLRPLVIVALYTGLRLRELLTLVWGRVSFERNQLTVEAGYAKNGTSRTIPLPGVVRETLLELRRERETSLGDTEAVFLNENGKPYRKPHNAFVAACKEAHIEDFRFHDLRHTYASRLVMGGLNLRTVQVLMGHKSIKMTERYAHLSPNHLQEAVAVLDQWAGSDSRQFPRHLDTAREAASAN